MRRTVLSIATLVVGVAVLTACGRATVAGSASADTTTAAPITTATQLAATVSATTSRAGTFHFTTQKTNNFVVSSGTGVLKLGSATQIDDTVTSTATFAQDSAGAQFEMVTVNGNSYVKPPKVLLSAGQAPWYQIHPNSPAWQNNQLMLPTLQTVEQDNDPATLINQLTPAATIASATPEQLGGLPTTHYVLTVDLAKLAVSLPASNDAKNLYQNLSQNGTKTTSFNVWLNADNLPVKYGFDVPAFDKTQNKTVHYNFTGTYSEWGQPVTIAAPPANQVGATPAGY